jgi:tetratricopeptide (TPR) repeat protein
LVAILCAGLICSVFAAFWGLFRCGFINFDDTTYVTEHARILKGLSWENVSWALRTTYFSNWHPLTWLSYMLDAQLYGLQAWGYHLTSLALHAANSVLLLLVLARMTGALWRSAYVAALFALHPLHVESVAWVAERKDVLSTLFWLLTLAAWLGFVRSRRPGWYSLAVGLYALGLMAKPMLVTLPFTLLLLDFWPLGRLALPLQGRWPTVRGLLLEKAPLFAMAAGASVVTYVAQQTSGAVTTLEAIPVPARVANTFLSYASYLGKTFWPTSLSVFYPYNPSAFSPGAVAGAFLAIVLATVLAVLLAKRAPAVTVGWLWYLGTLVPVIGLVQVGAQAMADRYTYVPLIGIFVALAWGLADRVAESPVARAALASAAALSLLPLFILTRVQVGYWKDSTALFEHALAVTANNSVAHNNLGVALSDRGEIESAVAQYREAIRIDPLYADSHNNLGVALAKQGKLEQAAEEYREALRLLPRGAFENRLELHIKLSSIRMKQNQFPEAVEMLGQVLEAAPDSFDGHLNMGIALEKMGRLPEAIGHFQRALGIKPESTQALNGMGQALARSGRIPEGMECFQRARKADPNSVDALVNIGVALDHEGRSSEALEQFGTALRIRPDSAAASKNMGLTLARTGRLPEAIEHLRRAAKQEPGDFETQYALGLALAREKQFVEARDRFRKAVGLRPGDPAAREGLRKVEEILR